MTEIEHLREALRNAARNDKTCYEYGEGRACDGKNPGDDGIWLTPREIARTALKEPNLATLSETLAAATEIPMDDCNLSINCGRDGTWLHFTAASGLCASINVDEMESKGSIITQAIRDWCDDRQKQATQIRADNGQFGVGA